MNKPPNSPIVASAAATGQCAAKSACQPICAAGVSGVAAHITASAAVRPMEPSGTRPISTVCRDSLSHRSEPAPTPTENTASSKVTTDSSPPSTSLAYAGSDDSTTDPSAQNQLMPISARNSVLLPCA
jgi:hypothetical protein